MDLWFEEVVNAHCRGKAMLIRYADDFVCAFHYREDAEAFYRVLPRRLAKFGLAIAPEKTRLLRFSRFHPGMRRRFAFLGFEFYWSVDRHGERRLMKRTAPKKLGRALKEFSDWVRTHRHLPTKELFQQVAWKLLGHCNYFHLLGNSRSIKEFHGKARSILLKRLQRRKRRHRMNGWRFFRLVELLGLPRPRIVPYPRSCSILLA